MVWSPPVNIIHRCVEDKTDGFPCSLFLFPPPLVSYVCLVGFCCCCLHHGLIERDTMVLVWSGLVWHGLSRWSFFFSPFPLSPLLSGLFLFSFSWLGLVVILIIIAQHMAGGVKQHSKKLGKTTRRRREEHIMFACPYCYHIPFDIPPPPCARERERDGWDGERGREMRDENVRFLVCLLLCVCCPLVFAC